MKALLSLFRMLSHDSVHEEYKTEFVDDIFCLLAYNVVLAFAWGNETIGSFVSNGFISVRILLIDKWKIVLD